jgi:hypothetical protein
MIAAVMAVGLLSNAARAEVNMTVLRSAIACGDITVEQIERLFTSARIMRARK